MVFHWGMRNSKSPKVSRTLLSILADFNNAIVWIVSSRTLISKSSSPCTNPLVTVPSAVITIGITVNFMFHSLFNALVRPRYLSFFSLSFNFTLQPGQQSPQFYTFSFFFSSFFLLLIIVWSRLDPFVYYYYYYYSLRVFSHRR